MPHLVDIEKLDQAEDLSFNSPVPTQIISNGEFTPQPQSDQQKQVEERVKELADTHGKKQGLSRRKFLGYRGGFSGGLRCDEMKSMGRYSTSAWRKRPIVTWRKSAPSCLPASSFSMTRPTWFMTASRRKACSGLATSRRKTGTRPLKKEELTLAYYKFDNYMRQMFVNSDTKIALLSGAPFDDESWTLLPNDHLADTVEMVNKMAGTRRMLGHFVMTPGKPGWMEAIEKSLEEGRHDGWKAYTIGDPLVGKDRTSLSA